MQRILAAVRPQVRFLTVAMLGAWTALNLLLSAASPLTRGWPIQATTALTVPLMVLAMVYLVIPVARRVAAAGIATSADNAPGIDGAERGCHDHHTREWACN